MQRSLNAGFVLDNHFHAAHLYPYRTHTHACGICIGHHKCSYCGYVPRQYHIDLQADRIARIACGVQLCRALVQMPTKQMETPESPVYADIRQFFIVNPGDRVRCDPVSIGVYREVSFLCLLLFSQVYGGSSAPVLSLCIRPSTRITVHQHRPRPDRKTTVH